MTRKGDRIELNHTADQYTDLKAGDQGTVTMIDALGTVQVKWDSGSTLGMVPGEDSFTIREPTDPHTTVWPETIFECRACGYKTSDTYTAGVINDLTGECPDCGADAALDKFGIWIEDPEWYGR